MTATSFSTPTRPSPTPPTSRCCRAERASQEGMLRDGRADVALMHAPFNSLAGFDSEELMTEGQIAVLPVGHPSPRGGPCPWSTSATSPTFLSPAGPATARTRPAGAPRSTTRRSWPS
ncbi:LysR substrate-binding domain-containing protein [Streptomyces sp. NPDC003781]|uniref:LysR substrate-binding domain-containing protein n=1 Tax=Streptomyces sp. NPDC003781 TaxID=3364686 RepID=UPI0036B362A8